MNALLLIYIPIIVAICWATSKTRKRGSNIDAVLVASVGTIIVINGVMKHFELQGYTSCNAAVFVQQLLSMLIIPLSYLYFAMLVNRPLKNGTSNSLFAMTALILVPNIVVVLDGGTNAVEYGFKTFTIVAGGESYVYTIADMVIPIQAVITLARILPLFATLRKYGLTPSRDVKVFAGWWVVAGVFALFSSATSAEGTSNTAIDIVCHIVFMLIITAVFFLIGRGINIVPVLAADDHEENNGAFKAMGMQLRELIDKQAIHLQNRYVVDNAIRELGTNKTYFYKMVKSEFGCTFSELMNTERMKEVKRLLADTDESLSTIAARCGFCNTSYMIKVFKQTEGTTPSEWRIMNKA